MNIFSKLNTLKSIKPDENWVVDAKKRVLLDAPVSEGKSVLSIFGVRLRSFGVELRKYAQHNLKNLSFQKMAVPAFSLVFVLSAGVFTVGASKSSLPGEFLYSLKMMNEDMILAVAPENKKATIEMEQAGKRLEEMAVISKKTSDVGQQEKIEQLMERFEKKVNNANDRLISGNGERAKVAKAINTQSKKYIEVLAETTEEFSAVVKDEISEDVAEAIKSSEKIYLTSLAVMTEGEEEREEEEDDKETTDTEENTEETAEIEEDTENNTEDTKEELLEDLEDLNNPEKDGEVLGVEDCVCVVEDECGCEEEVMEEEIEEEI